MIDARNTLRKVNTTINDFSPGQLRNFNAIMAAFRGDETAISTARNEHQQQTQAQAQEIIKAVNQLRLSCLNIIKQQSTELDFSTAEEDQAV